mgnify:CR=1 FL=1
MKVTTNVKQACVLLSNLANLKPKKHRDRKTHEQRTKEKLKTEEEDIKEIKVAVDNEIEAINQERNVIYDKRNELLDQFDKKILTFYEKIKRWAKDTAVVPVKQQACYGCFIKINDKTYAEVLKGEEIVNCLHCGRILYKGEEETDVTEA